MIQFVSKWNSYFVLLSVVFAIIFGVTVPSVFEHFQFLGDLFINLLKLFALPLICSALFQVTYFILSPIFSFFQRLFFLLCSV